MPGSTTTAQRYFRNGSDAAKHIGKNNKDNGRRATDYAIGVHDLSCTNAAYILSCVSPAPSRRSSGSGALSLERYRNPGEAK